MGTAKKTDEELVEERAKEQALTHSIEDLQGQIDGLVKVGHINQLAIKEIGVTLVQLNKVLITMNKLEENDSELIKLNSTRIDTLSKHLEKHLKTHLKKELEG